MSIASEYTDRKLHCDYSSSLPLSTYRLMLSNAIRDDFTRPGDGSDCSDISGISNSNSISESNTSRKDPVGRVLQNTQDVSSLLEDMPGLLDTLDHQKVLQSYLGSRSSLHLPDPKKRSLKLRVREALKMQTRSALEDGENRCLPTPTTPPPALSPLTRHTTSTPSMISTSRPSVKIRALPNPSLVGRGPMCRPFPSRAMAPTQLPTPSPSTVASRRERSVASSCASSTCSSSVSANSFSTAGNSCVSSATSHTAAYTPLSTTKKMAASPTTALNSPQPTHSLSSSLADTASRVSPPIVPALQSSSSPSSRFISALQRWRPTSRTPTNSVVPDASGTRADIKMTPSKSSLTNKIKTRLQLDKKKVDRISRSVSLSSLTLSSTRLSCSDPLSKNTTVPSESRSRGGILKTNKYGMRLNHLQTPSAELPRTQFSPRPSGYASMSVEDLRPLYHLQREQKLYDHSARVPDTLPQCDSSIGRKRNRVKFASVVSISETFCKEDYDRGSDPEAIYTRLTPILAQRIKDELNTYKLYEMKVHDLSIAHTHFFL